MTFLDAMKKDIPPLVEEEEVVRPSPVPLKVKRKRHIKEEEGFPGVSHDRLSVFPEIRKDCGCIFPSEGTIMDRAVEILGTTERRDNRLLNARDHGTHLVLDIITGTPQEKIEDLVKIIGKQTRYSSFTNSQAKTPP
jgi:hypothetical protein